MYSDDSTEIIDLVALDDPALQEMVTGSTPLSNYDAIETDQGPWYLNLTRRASVVPPISIEHKIRKIRLTLVLYSINLYT